MKLGILSLTKAHFEVCSIATDSKIAEKQAKKLQFLTGSPPTATSFESDIMSFSFWKEICPE
jgi:hypothetical protein